MKQKIPIRSVADSSGIIRVERLESIPIPIRLKRVAFQTSTNCRQRTHVLRLDVAGDRLVDGAYRDCAPFSQDVSKKLRGMTSILVVAEGFDSGEIVEGVAEIEYSLFAFF